MQYRYVSTAIQCVALLAAAGSAFAHGDHEKTQKLQHHYGHPASLGGGIVRTYVELAKEKDEASNRKPPVTLGIEISDAAVTSLPAQPASLMIDLPLQARDTPFQFMMFDWNPSGHEPAGVYDKPHFDFHFYIQDQDDVMQIDPGPCNGLACDDYERARTPVPPQFAPEGYIDVGSVVPYMGNHLVDPTSPEFNGQLFTRTWLYGAYDGKITFYEPMITLKSLTENPNQCVALKLPAQYAETGYYPKTYCTSYDTEAKVYRVFLKDFVYRFAPNRRR